MEELDLPENGTISASFLGAAVLELTGRGEQTPWFAFLNELRRMAPVVQKKTYMLPDGTYRRPQDPAETFPMTSRSRTPFCSGGSGAITTCATKKSHNAIKRPDASASGVLHK